MLRSAGTAVVAVLAVGLTPAVADASPQRPSDSEIARAQDTANSVADSIRQLAAQLDTAQGKVDDAHAASAIALDDYQSTQAAYQAARTRADAAKAAAAKATARVGVARGDVVAFARRSYMQGSNYSGAAALVTAGDPAQLIERAALLEAAGSHRSSVLDDMKVAQTAATGSEAVARGTLAQADHLKAQAASALTVAKTAEISARAQAAALTTQKATLATNLAVAKTELSRLVGARVAADRLARAIHTAPAPAPAPAPRPTPLDDAPQAGPGNQSAARTAIDAAKAYLGTPYAWGGGGSRGPGRGLPPDSRVIGFDCSGLTQYAYAQAGISIPRNSRAQYTGLPRVSSDNLQAGDLVFWATDPGDSQTIHHVAIYLGDGQVLQAPESGDVIKISAMWWSGYAGAVRPSA